MRTRNVLILAAALLFSMTAFGADMTVDEVLAKNTEAKGGAEKLSALQSIRLSGKMSMGPMEAPFTMTKMRPERLRIEFTIQGMTGIQAFDGTGGWQVMPFMGKKDAEPMAEEAMKQFKEEADFDGPFIDYTAKGHKLELLGKEDVEGTPAYKLKLVTKDGNESTVYLDADSFLEIKIAAKRKVQGQEMESETSFGNYQEVGGLLFPYSIEMKSKGAPAGQNLTIEKVELNPTVTADMFTMPKKAEVSAEKKQ